MPPYDSVVSDGVIAAGFGPTDTVQLADFMAGAAGTLSAAAVTTKPNLVYLGLSLLPSDLPAIGTAKDFPAGSTGSIIPTEVFPIVVRGRLMIGDQVYHKPFFTEYSRSGMIHDGASHVIGLHATGVEFKPSYVADVRGTYTWEFEVRDRFGNGWNFQKVFVVQ